MFELLIRKKKVGIKWRNELDINVGKFYEVIYSFFYIYVFWIEKEKIF